MTADGRKTLFRDSKLGNLANGAVVALALYLVDAVRGLDLTPLPDAIEPVGVALAGVAVGMLTSWISARRKDDVRA